ncbi:MAG TPA: sugar ABC transporter permease [Spirochaetia bacterium]|nr:sugar ABC transporter permease [Spirochaetia bacterium]
MKPPKSPALAKAVDHSLGLVFLLPALVVFAYFQWYPILFNFLLGFQQYTPGYDPVWSGWSNFGAVLTDPQLPQAAWNTVVFVVLCLIIGYLVPVAAAVMLGEVRRGKGFFRLAIYMPRIIPGIALYIIWRWIFDPQFGLANQVLGLVGIGPQGWLLDQNQVMVALVIMSTWANFGGTAILYMATLTSVSTELYEAAELDGAGFWGRIRAVTLPSLSSTMKLLLILQLIGTFQVLQEPFVMTGGGPAGASTTLMYLVYNYAFVNAEFGKAGALGTLIFLALLILSVLYVRRSDLAVGKGV